MQAINLKTPSSKKKLGKTIKQGRRLHWIAVALYVLASVAALPSSAATFTVTDTLDGGPGSLSNAFFQANGSLGTKTIAFNIPPLDGTV
jgi:hypothetical protein